MRKRVPRDVAEAVRERCVALAPGSKSQYEDAGVECGPGSVVEAIYVKSPVPGRGFDPFTACLPLPACDSDDADLKCEEVEGYSRETVGSMSLAQRVLALACLCYVRVCLPFLLRLESVVGTAVAEAYQGRHIGPEGVVIEVSEAAGDLATGTCAWTDQLQGVNGGPNVHGIAGCGKTSGMASVLERYPQVVVHDIPGVLSCVQVVWIAVNCSTNNDLGSLYEAIGGAMDRALHTQGQPYQRMVERARKLGAKARRVAELLRTFSVGILVLDEAQMLGLGNKASSFKTLVQVVNETRVSLCLVGTEETPEVVCGDLYLKRRADMDVRADDYRTEPFWGEAVVDAVARYTWTLAPVRLTDAGKAALRTCTGGSAGLIVDVWKRVQLDLMETERNLLADGKALPGAWKVGAKEVQRCFAENFGGIGRALDAIDTEEGSRALAEALSAERRAFQDRAATLQEDQAEEAAKEAALARRAKELEDKVAEAADIVAGLAQGVPRPDIEGLCREEASDPCAVASDVAVRVLSRLAGRGAQEPVRKPAQRVAKRPKKKAAKAPGTEVPKALSDTFTRL